MKSRYCVARTGLLGSAALACAIWSGSAAAAPDAADVDAAQHGGLEEIVVTAQHRREDLQAVPISVATVSGAALASAGVDSTQVLSQMVPAVQMTRSGPSGLFFIRGVGTTNAAAGEEGANAFYVDGVYISDLGQTINNFNNVERIEVLKGPQGTLFGRNATGGLIHIITRDPGDETVVRGQLGLANYQTVSGQFYVAGPISDKAAIDLAFTGSDQGKGWGRNLTRDTENRLGNHWGMRSKAVFRPNEDVKITLAGDYFHIKDNNSLAWRLDQASLGLNPGGPGFVAPEGHDTTSNDPTLTNQKIWGGSLKVEADLGFASLTSVSAIRDVDNHSYFDVDGGPLRLVFFDYTSKSRTYQQEIRLASAATEPLAWQAGVFYLRANASNSQHLRGLSYARIGQGTDLLGKMTTDSYAAFAEVTYALTPGTHVTAGLRYTEDHRKYGGHITTVLADGSFGTTTHYPRPGIDAFGDRLKYNQVTYRLSIRQELNDDVNVYASINRGFKAGAFSIQTLDNPPLKPQFIMAYEVGLKSELFDRRLRLNVAAYHYDIDDYQIRSVLNSTAYLINAGTVKVDGFDADFEAAPTDRLRIFGGFNVLKSKFGKFAGSLFYYPSPAACAVAPPASAAPGTSPGASVGAPTGGLTVCYGDAGGLYTPFSPKFSGNIGASYSIPVSESGEVKVNVLYAYNDGYYFEPENALHQDGFGLINASVLYQVNKRLGVEIWGKNIGDKTYYTGRFSTALGYRSDQAAPRTYGVSLKFEY